MKGEEWRGVPLTAYLHKPIARVCKYPLLLRELLKHTPESCSDHAPLTEAHTRICAVVDRINERTRQVEAMQRLDEIEKSLDGAKDLMLAQLTRRFVREVNCKDTKKDDKKDDAHLFLFNDLLLLARPRKKNRYEVKKHAPLTSVTCNESVDNPKCIEVTWPDGVKDSLEFSTADERNAWRSEIQLHALACKEEAKKKPGVVTNTSGGGGGGGGSTRGKLTRTISDSHIKNAAIQKPGATVVISPAASAEVTSSTATTTAQTPTSKKVPTLLVANVNPEQALRSDTVWFFSCDYHCYYYYYSHSLQPSSGKSRHILIDVGRGESPRSARKPNTDPPHKKDLASLTRDELMKEVITLQGDKEALQAAMNQLKADVTRVGVGLKEEVTTLREKLLAVEKERDELRSQLLSLKK